MKFPTKDPSKAELIDPFDVTYTPLPNDLLVASASIDTGPKTRSLKPSLMRPVSSMATRFSFRMRRNKYLKNKGLVHLLKVKSYLQNNR